MFIIICPHCNGERFIEQLNCGIFRDGVFKHNLEQIPPHSTKEECDKYLKNDMIFGCGKPFQITIENNEINVQKCDYI